jgi:hypothetical protein
VADDKRAACAGHSGRAEVEKVHIYFILVGLGRGRNGWISRYAIGDGHFTSALACSALTRMDPIVAMPIPV